MNGIPERSVGHSSSWPKAPAFRPEIGLLSNLLRLPVVLFPIANHDNNQHGPDENIRLQNLWDGIEMFAGILAKLGKQWR